jgi:hypothetical protein
MIDPNKVHTLNSISALQELPDASVKAMLLSPPSTSRAATPNVLDGLAALYLGCKKATAYVVFFWRLRDIPRPPMGWFEAARHVWHNPNTTSTQYELIIVWSKSPNLEPGRVWSIPVQARHVSKPVRLWRHLIDRYSEKGDTLLLPFAGAGNAPLACQQLGRTFIAMESHTELARLANARLAHRPLTDYDERTEAPDG